MAIRSKPVRMFGAALAGVALAAAGPVVATASAAATGVIASTALPLSGYSAIAADSSRHQLFVSGGGASDAIVVTDFSGNLVTTITGEPGAASLVLSRDGHTLYVALPGADAISAIDTTTLRETARYTTGAGAAPVHLAVIGNDVWFSYGSSGVAGIGRLDVRHAAVTLTREQVFYAAPLLAASPSAPDVLVAGETYQEPSVVETFDVSSGTPVPMAQTNPWLSGDCANANGLAITPDGGDVLMTCGYPYRATSLTLPGLAQDGTYQTGPYTGAVAVARHGEIAVGVRIGSESVDLFDPGNSTPIAAYKLGQSDVYGLTWDRDGHTLFAVTLNVYNADPILYVIDAN